MARGSGYKGQALVKEFKREMNGSIKLNKIRSENIYNLQGNSYLKKF